MIFADRREAGEKLAEVFLKKKLDPSKSIVVAIPRGGVVVGEEIALRFNIPLTVLVIKKLGAPDNPELAIGATVSFGKPVLDRWLARDLGVKSEFLKKEIATKKKEAKIREKFLNIKVSPKMFKGKIAIVVDDGIATGQTAKMAARVLRQFEVAKLILAVGCASLSTVDEMEKEYDSVICPQVSADFWAVGQFYKDFRPVKDSEVKRILNSQLPIDN